MLSLVLFSFDFKIWYGVCFYICISTYPALLTLLRMGIFRNTHGCGGGELPFLKICHTFPTMMKLGSVVPYLKKIQKNMNHVTHTLTSADISIFYRKSAHFVISRNTDIDCILVHKF